MSILPVSANRRSMLYRPFSEGVGRGGNLVDHVESECGWLGPHPCVKSFLQVSERFDNTGSSLRIPNHGS